MGACRKMSCNEFLTYIGKEKHPNTIARMAVVEKNTMCILKDNWRSIKWTKSHI